MSFENYSSFQNQQGQQDAGGAGSGAPQQQDTTMGGQLPDNPAAQFQGGSGGDPGSAGGQQPGGDAKTTLWYEVPFDYIYLIYNQHYCGGKQLVINIIAPICLSEIWNVL